MEVIQTIPRSKLRTIEGNAIPTAAIGPPEPNYGLESAKRFEEMLMNPLNEAFDQTSSRSMAQRFQPAKSIQSESPESVLGSLDEKRDFRMFDTLAAKFAVSTKAKYSDMRDCHNVSAQLVEVLKHRGFADAMVIHCAVLTGDGDAIHPRIDENGVEHMTEHSVVVVAGCLIDATVGQFHSSVVQIPDYLVIPERIAVPMLQTNRRWQEGKTSMLRSHFEKTGGMNFSIIYIPIDLERSGKSRGLLKPGESIINRRG